MRVFRLFAVLSLVLLTAMGGSARPIALVGGRLIDGFGGPPLANSVILIEGDRIKAVGEVGELPIPADAEVISTEGMYVLPGLWDCHVHTMLLGHSNYEHWDKTYPERFGTEIMPAAAKQFCMAGVTSARDLGAPLKESIEVRDRIKRGEIPGPTLYVSGPFIQHEPYPGTEAFRWGVKGADDARAKVKQARRSRREHHQADRPGSDDDGGSAGGRRRRRTSTSCRSSRIPIGPRRSGAGWRRAPIASSTPASRRRPRLSG